MLMVLDHAWWVALVVCLLVLAVPARVSWRGFLVRRRLRRLIAADRRRATRGW